MEQAWIIPLFGISAFIILALFRHYLPWQGKHIAVIAALLAFLGSWVVVLDLIGSGTDIYYYPREWFAAGSLKIGWGIIVDPLTAVMLILVTSISFLVQLYSLGYMRHHANGVEKDDPRIGWYFAAHSLFMASMLTLVLADNLLLLYIGWELVGLCSYLLIGFWYEREAASQAAKKAFITTRIGDVGLLIGIILLVVEVGSFDIRTILDSVTSGEASQSVVTTSAFLLFLGAMGKSAQFPLHVWLPDAMEGPTPVSALIHAATMVTAGVFLVARLFPLFEAVESAQLAIAIVGIVTALAGASMALVMTDLKRILAYSTMSHLGFMMLALGAGGYTAAVFHLLMHGIAKAMLFLTAGSIMHSMHDETNIKKMGGLRSRMPITAAAFALGALSLAGVPPLNAFWSKDEIVLAVTENLNPIFVIFLFVAIVLSALYMFRAAWIVFGGKLSKDNERVQEAPKVMSVPVVFLAALTVGTGFLALPLFGDYDGIGAFVYSSGHAHAFEVNILWMTISIALAGLGILLGYRLYVGDHDLLDQLRIRLNRYREILENRFYVDHFYEWIVRGIINKCSDFLGRFDRKIVNDLGVDSSGILTMGLSYRLRKHITGLFSDYGLSMALGVAVLVLFIRLGS
ncbi:MAG: NADH-quinone oxidoreductase subunit L [Chloroflexi bacterium]|nr:NADH-quinone oxidoreductase subunit L [Chloroflexota bacterium]